MQCQVVGTASFLQALIAVVAFGIIYFWVVQTYAPSWIVTPLMAVSALGTPFAAFLGFLFVAYGESPVCYTKAVSAGPTSIPLIGNIIWFMLPYCLLDDVYDMVDIFFFPRNVDWGDTLVTRLASGAVNATNATACVNTLGFDDGFHNIAYLIQRMAGNDYIDKNAWVKYIALYPIHDALTAFQGVQLQPNDVYEHCFWITSVNIFPALALVGIVVLVELLIVYIVWTILSTGNVLLRDVRNTAILFGMYNDELKEAYAESSSRG